MRWMKLEPVIQSEVSQKEKHIPCKQNSAFESVLRWMKLEPIIQSEVSQKEKYQYSILMHVYGI